MADIAEWLQSIGLPQYRELFASEEIDGDVLAELTELDLERLGLPLGHRKKLLKAIAGTPSFEPQFPIPQVSQIPRSGSSSRPRPERRHVTVVFCDIVGSTEISAHLDPEDFRAILRDYQDACAGAVARFEGHVIRFLGDGVLACFGYPQAHEDDAERAVRAALRIAQAVRRLKLNPEVALEIRIGVESGLVVAGDLIGLLASDEQTLIGETPNVASRLQALAKPGTVVIGPGTRRLLGHVFDLEDCGFHQIKGLARPVPIWRVVGEGIAESRFAAARLSAPADVIGREEELGLLLKRWEQARRGEGQVALLSGEAGIGKSRIAEHLCERIADKPRRIVRFQCSPHHRNSPLHPIIRQLERAAKISAPDDTETKLGRLEAFLRDSLKRSSRPLEPPATISVNEMTKPHMLRHACCFTLTNSG
jgi:class 3 adenylate cyclase